MRSIRIYLVVASLATITLINFVSVLHGYRQSTAEVQKLFDTQLEYMADLLTSMTGNAVQEPVNPHSTPGLSYQVWGTAGSILMRSENAPISAMEQFQAGFHESNHGTHRWRTLVRQDAKTGHWIMVAGRTDLRHTVADDITIKTVLPVIASIPLTGLIVWLITGHGLQPLRQLSQALGNKRAEDLAPLEISPVPVELGQVVQSTNDLLKRLESHYQREKQFAEDTAHELRTPISGLKIHLHNLSGELETNNHTIERIKGDIDHMGHLVEQILALHRTTPTQFMQNTTVVNLHALAQEVIVDLYERFIAKRQNISLEGAACNIRGDHFSLRTLISNLLDNACKYTPDNGTITVGVAQSDGYGVLRVEDTGIGIPVENRSMVFERFYRFRNDNRVGKVYGAGLGLSIVKHIADLHGASLDLNDTPTGTGLMITVKFPLATNV